VYADTLGASEAGCDSVRLTSLVIAEPLRVTYEQISACGLRTAEVRLTVTGGLPPYRYDWGAAGVEGPIVTLGAGAYTVTVTDSLGCEQNVIPVRVTTGLGALRLVAEPPSCFGAEDGAIRVEPAGSASLRLLTDTAYTADALTGLGSGSYRLILRSGDSCEVFREVSLPFSPFLAVGIAGPQRVGLGKQAVYTANLRARVGPISYLWSPGGEANCADCFSTDLTVTGDTTISLQVTDGNGCTASDTLRVQVVEDDVPVYVPTAFSPQGDGTNDRWVPGLGPGVVEIVDWRVYDRWGGEQWAWRGMPWDGGSAAAGVYVYHLTVRLVNGRTLSRRGEVTLLR
jgi:hypothetical protein